MTEATIVRLQALPLHISPKTIWIFLSVTDSEGLTGLGEATLAGREREVMAVAARLASSCLGTAARPSPLGTAVPHRDMPEASVFSALDQALWDLEGQRLGKPVWQALGAANNRDIPLYANINRRTVDRSPAGFAASARDAVGVGFTMLKVAPFDAVTPAGAETDEGRRLTEAGIARVASVREAAGPDVRVMVDCHWRFTERASVAVIDRLAELGVTWFECPVPEPAEAVPVLRRLRAKANARGMQLAGLEMSTSPDDLRPFVTGGCYDVVMPDMKYIGGYGGMLAVGALCATNGVVCAPHNPSGPICHAASLHAAAALPGFEVLEHQYDESPLFDALVGGRLPDHAGKTSALPTGPGLGVALDPAVVAEIRVDFA